MFELLDDKIERYKPSLRASVLSAIVFAFFAGFQAAALLISTIKHVGDWMTDTANLLFAAFFAVFFGKSALSRSRELE